jgi:urease accessory protein
MNAPEAHPMAGLAAELEPSRQGWAASLDLAFAARGAATIPTLRSHRGPLRVQKGFTPEGPGVWHQVIVHPPGGIASGDSLDVRVVAKEGARAVLTSPGAAKWYCANALAPDPWARQTVRLAVEHSASLEWLPLETIVFPGAQASWQTQVDLEGEGSLIAADLVCLGRPASDQAFDTGEIRWRTDVRREGRLIFHEQVQLSGGAPLLKAQAGLAGHSAFASMIIAPGHASVSAVVERVRDRLQDEPGDWAVTGLPELAILRWRGPGAEAGWRVLRAAWAASRPLAVGREACPPRIWAT